MNRKKKSQLCVCAACRINVKGRVECETYTDKTLLMHDKIQSFSWEDRKHDLLLPFTLPTQQPRAPRKLNPHTTATL